MKTHHPKLKTPTRPFFSCGFFRYCTQTLLSPTTPHTPTLPPPLPPPAEAADPLPSGPHPDSGSSTSSSSTSQSFTQWRFPLPQSPLHPHNYHHQPTSQFHLESQPLPLPTPPVQLSPNLAELFHVAELHFSTGSDSDRLSALHLLESSLIAKPSAEGTGERACPSTVMKGVVGFLKDPTEAKPATKVLLGLCLEEGNRHVAVEAGAVAEVVETLAGLEGSAAERALAALDLLCTVPEGAAEVRAHALAVPMLMEMIGKVAGRGRECAISVLYAIFGGNEGVGGGVTGVVQREEVRQAVVVALQGKCSARGRRKGSQLLKLLQIHDDENGRIDFTDEGRQ